MKIIFAQKIIDQVHELWFASRKRYPAGYAVFYGPVRYKPSLMLIGLNPGGGEGCFSGKKEELIPINEPMEYIKYRNDSSYRIAGKTVRIFESIGLLNILETSVKTNLNFFRSKEWDQLDQKDSEKCFQILSQIIDETLPDAILCESIYVFDLVKKHLSDHCYFISRHKRVNVRNKRIYVSERCGEKSNPKILIGITHLTGSRPSSIEIDQIKELLRDDLSLTTA